MRMGKRAGGGRKIFSETHMDPDTRMDWVCTKAHSNEQRRIDALRLTGSGVGCLDSFIRSANSNRTPLDLATIKMAREIEQHSPGCRLTMIRLLDREIRRQEIAQSKVQVAA